MSLPDKFKYSDDLIEWLALFYDEVNKRQTVVDLTSATSDYTLSVNETAKIDISAASTALNIAVEDGEYEITIQFERDTFASDQDLSLSPNNTTYTNEFDRSVRIGTDGAATEVLAFNTTESSFRVATGAWHFVNCKLIIFGDHRTLRVYAGYVASSNRRTLAGDIYWDSSTAYTSLGTLGCGEAATGVCYVKRTA